jgi:hypothetical protein
LASDSSHSLDIKRSLMSFGVEYQTLIAMHEIATDSSDSECSTIVDEIAAEIGDIRDTSSERSSFSAMAKRHMSLDLLTTATASATSSHFDVGHDRRSHMSDDWEAASVKRLQSETIPNVAVNGTVHSSARKERKSPTVGCKRPMAIGLPRLNLSLING